MHPPQCYAATGDFATGETLLLVECVANSYPAGLAYGSGNPNNWGTALPQGWPSPVEMTQRAFALYARLHAEFWADDILSSPWLRGCAWRRGEGEASWRAAQQIALDGWRAMSADIADWERDPSRKREGKLCYDPHLIRCLRSSFTQVEQPDSWGKYQDEFKRVPRCLVHGDAHPHNLLFRPGATLEEEALKMIDFEMVGVGSPAQELGQFLISHMDVATRRAHRCRACEGEAGVHCREGGMGVEDCVACRRGFCRGSYRV